MIKRKELQKKSLAAVMAASMTMSLLPGTALADATSGVLADGTYESTAHVPELQKTMRMRMHGMNMTLMSKSQLQTANFLTLQ